MTSHYTWLLCITDSNSASWKSDMQQNKNEYFRFKGKNSSLLVENWMWPQLDIQWPAVQSLGLERFFSFFGPFQFHIICP